jgi:hypothetical protein
MQTQRTRIVVFIALLLGVCSIGTPWIIRALSALTPPEPEFQHHQWVEMQIVTAPTQSTRDGYIYDEAEVVVHSTHRILIDASGDGKSFYSVSNEIPIEITYSFAEPGVDEAGIILRDLAIYFPVKFQVNDHLGYKWQGFTARDTTVMPDYHSFQRGISLYYQEDPLSNTFLRMRHAGNLGELPVIDLAPAINAE